MAKYKLTIEFESISTSVHLVMELMKPIIRGALNELVATNVVPILELVEEPKRIESKLEMWDEEDNY